MERHHDDDIGLNLQLRHVLTPHTRPLLFPYPRDRIHERIEPTSKQICDMFCWRSFTEVNELKTRELDIKPKSYDRLLVEDLELDSILLENTTTGDTFEFACDFEVPFYCEFRTRVLYIPPGYGGRIVLPDDKLQYWKTQTDSHLYYLKKIKIQRYNVSLDELKLALSHVNCSSHLYVIHRDAHDRARVEQLLARFLPPDWETTTATMCTQLYNIQVLSKLHCRWPSSELRVVRMADDGTYTQHKTTHVHAAGIAGRFVWGERERKNGMVIDTATGPEMTATLISFTPKNSPVKRKHKEPEPVNTQAPSTNKTIKLE